jgi:hypothetical protein
LVPSASSVPSSVLTACEDGLNAGRSRKFIDSRARTDRAQFVEKHFSKPGAFRAVAATRCPTKRAGELRQKAERYRRLERDIGDAAANKAISELSDEFEMTAAELERHHHVRERAHEIWLERDVPQGWMLSTG